MEHSRGQATDDPDWIAAANQPELVEAIARVVALEGKYALLEPEQSTSCGSCVAAGHCGSREWGSAANRLIGRRFTLVNTDEFRVGERLVIGVSHRALLRASMTAYVLPLLIMLLVGIVAQSLAGDDVITMIATAIGLGIGLLAARGVAYILSATGQLAPYFLRRANRSATTCQITAA
ncbi:SoxR reducing system RseC family protein [Rhodoferax sp. 4810]|uniref:SoxR reducing system RseC family protein n=1 Tax=Thiospirillum jenense TaxID=1653858 RepID=A0A839H8X0_9GAMM|nr:SoxR reducing system RseC family protein [Thiospirillum jenense]MBB1073929.1 SoxR reducing system RseC family protein [Rhodoferax jenense]MBB1125805.1 SoxR reducing system RseC family protein [Thiospirillum jenense]